MKKISDLLKKFSSFGLEERTIKERIINLLEENYKINIEKSQIKIKDGKIFLSLSGVPKTIIVLNKKGVLNELNLRIKELGVEIFDIN